MEALGPLVVELDAAGSTGLDLSPGDPLCERAADALRPFQHPCEGRQQMCKQSGTRYYGDGGTWHDTTHLHVETHRGKVVAVWFRCQLLPFEQAEVEPTRADSMLRAYDGSLGVTLHGVEVKDTVTSK